ncbi:MAG: hypothetical protein DLM58_21990 [Pseudonocardiales bacterium]|nr:MAG: hypothetical protein DLM58_21990 [Pseudonocardiales bacterium]
MRDSAALDVRPQAGAGGSIEWTSPTGHRYLDEQPTYPVDLTMQRTESGERSSPSDPHPPQF